MLVVMVMLLEPAVAAPMVKPESVMVTALGDAIVPLATVTAVELEPDVAALKVRPCDAAVIWAPETKKPDG